MGRDKKMGKGTSLVALLLFIALMLFIVGLIERGCPGEPEFYWVGKWRVTADERR